MPRFDVEHYKKSTTMRNLVSILALCFFITTITNAQTETEAFEDFELENLPDFTKNYQFGIMLELNNSTPNSKQNNLTQIGLSDRVNSVTTTNEYGIAIGVLYGYEFNDFLTVRTQAMLSFLKNSYNFDLNNEFDATLTRETVNIEVPIHLVLENTTKKIAPSLIVGGRYRHNIAQNTYTSQLAGNYNENDFLLDAGVGISFKFDNFRFKTELLYSHGLTNQVADNEALSLPSALGSSSNNQLSLRFLFYM